MTNDPFGTGALRRAVIGAWLASPTRFREDANSEEDHARGYYRDRVVVELAQNAADAAARAGVPGRLTLRLEARTYQADGGGSAESWWLVAGNTGAPLDADGVASLASLRASAKVGESGGAGEVVADTGSDVVGSGGAGSGVVGSGVVGSGVARSDVARSADADSAGSGELGGAGRLAADGGTDSAGTSAGAGRSAADGGSDDAGWSDDASGRDSTGIVGRFGVGFAAVRSVSDEVLVRSRGGGVRFSLAATRAALGLGPSGPEIGPSLAADAEVGPLLDADPEVGPLHRDRSSDGPISMQPTELSVSVQRATDFDGVAVERAAEPGGPGGGSLGVERLTASARVRGAALPVLRLPFPGPGTTPDEPDTVVELRLRDAEAVAAVRAQLAAVDDALLLALPALDEVVIEDDFAGQRGSEPVGTGTRATSRVLRDVGSRWRVHRASGALEPDESLPSEARRPDWSVLWALPTTSTRAAVSPVLHAQTPTDVRLTFPALLIASFPVDPGRRGVLPGPTSDRVAAEAGRAYAAFLGELGTARDILALVPTGLPASDVDAAVRASAVDALRDTPLLALSVLGQPSEDEERDKVASLVAPRDAAFLAGPLGEDQTLARSLAVCSPRPLVTVPVRHQALARSLGADALDLADLVEALPPDPGVVRAALDALAPHAGEPAVLEAVAGAPLPLADGRVARGARGTVLLDAPHLAGIARALGVRVVHPEAAHPVLERVGAAHTTPRGLLADAAVRSAALAAAEEVLEAGDAGRLAGAAGINGAADAGDDVQTGPPDDPTPAETVSAALELVRLAVAEAGPEGLPFWLGELPAAADGDVVPLREAALPGTWAARNLDLAVLSDSVVERWGDAALRAAGARAGLGVYRVVDVVTPDDGDDADYGPDDPAGWLADWDEYLDHLADELGPGAWIGDLEAVSDLDALREGQAADAPRADAASQTSLAVGQGSLAGSGVDAVAQGSLAAAPDADAVAQSSLPAAPDVDSAARTPLAAALARFSAEPDLRRALLTPVRSPDAPGRQAVSYTAWFLRRRLGAPFALGETPLLPPAPPETAGLDPELRVALGGLYNLADLRGHDWPAVLERLPGALGEAAGRPPADGEVARELSAEVEAAREPSADVEVPGDLPAHGEAAGDLSADVARAVWSGLAALARTGESEPIAPARLPALGPDGVTVESTDDLAVAASPRWAQLAPVVPAPPDVAEALADLLDLPLENDPDVVPDGPGESVELDPRVRALAPGAPATWQRHEALTVEGKRVAWWVSEAGGVAHAVSPAGLARALAELTGADALLLEAALHDPSRAAELNAERVWTR